MNATDNELLFVYGTLRGGGNPQSDILAASSTLVGEGRARGALFDLGEYPGFVPEDNASNSVVGEVYRVKSINTPPIWRDLDEYEGGEYSRRRIRVLMNDGRERVAWTYVLNSAPPNAIRIPGGDYAAWRGRLAGKDDQS